MTQLNFDGRVAIITGAGQGLGRTYAKRLAERGARVVVNDIGSTLDGTVRDKPNLAEQVAAEIRDTGGLAVADANSVSETDGAAAIVSTALEQFGQVDILINNAGIWQFHAFDDYSSEAFARDLAVHVWGPWNMAQAVWPKMKKQRYGRIMNTISSAIFGIENSAGYCTVKAATIGFTRALATEAINTGVCVNALEPSASTRMGRPLFNDGQVAWRNAYQSADMAAAGALWLVHQDCTANGGLYSCWSGRFGAFFLAANKGQWTEPAAVTPEWVSAQFEHATVPNELFFPDHAGAYSGSLRTRMQLPDAPAEDSLRKAAKSPQQ